MVARLEFLHPSSLETESNVFRELDEARADTVSGVCSLFLLTPVGIILDMAQVVVVFNLMCLFSKAVEDFVCITSGQPDVPVSVPE